ncbi:hypothetical protein [Halococcus sediminicola]|nr:hypothetical protein [Halococcus sediminicola]
MLSRDRYDDADRDHGTNCAFGLSSVESGAAGGKIPVRGFVPDDAYSL